MKSAGKIRALGYAKVAMNQPPSSYDATRRKRDTRRLPVFLPDELWDELTYAAEYSTEVFENTGEPEKVSRNDFIEDSLRFALKAFWADKGGRPRSPAEFAASAKRRAEKVKAKEAAEAETAPQPSLLRK